MHIQGLGYVGLRSARLDDWTGYATGFLGLQLAERSSGELTFRMDDRRQRLFVAGDMPEGPAVFGWEVADATALDAAAARLEAAGVQLTRGSAALADRRHVAGIVQFADPVGNRLELFHGAEIADAPFQPGRCISGFRTGPLGMGHMVLTVQHLDEVVPFYRNVMGFQLTDWFEHPFRAVFMHVNARHHSLALIETGKLALHHVMMELFSLDDVGQGYDLALGEEGRIATTLGRHPNDFMTSFYARTPDGAMIEYGWGGRAIDPATWQAEEQKHGPSLWGHDRVWMSPEAREQSRVMRLQAAAEGLRQPVQVLPGNHNIMPGICPWWDRATNGAARV